MYAEGLAGAAGLSLPREPVGCRGGCHQYVVRHATRDALAEHLRVSGIHTQVHYPVPIHRQLAYAGCGLAAGELPETEVAAREVLSLPLYPELPPVQVKRVIDAVKDFCRRQ